MSTDEAPKRDVDPVSDEELAKLNDAAAAKFGVFVNPGESLSLQAERTAEHSHVEIVLEAGDRSFRLQVEAAALEEDQPDHDDVSTPRQRLKLAIDFVDAMLEEYFEEDRTLRLHPDWRLYDFEGGKVRFRGRETRPELDALADAWLEAGGEPDEQ